MKPVAIFRHSPGEGPGYFATFLDSHSVPWTMIKIDAGEAVPAMPGEYAGLCFMGGPMSVNDKLPWIEPVCALIRDAVAAEVPVIGHCLGGQLMSKALGGQVTKNRVKELGWGKVSRCGTPPAEWLGDIESFEAFHWHGETFSIPPGASRLMSSHWCDNQAFVMGPHLGLQCHVEMTEAMIRLWCRQWADECAQPSASVQSPEQMNERMEERVAAMRIAADRLYARWIGGLKS
ncbi:MAG: type 1 glutamine amidotransferase [Rhodocyclales bacterium]|nr:type 1 glutamine amidotransferase [Rhodocyclales bacterium]